jgi:predicted amidohydrolase
MVVPMRIALAAANMSKGITCQDQLVARVRRLALEARGCNILILPEYFPMLTLGYAPPGLKQTEEVAWMAKELVEWDFAGEIAGVCERFGIAILPGTWPVETDSGYKNRAHFITGDGVLHTQDKLALTDEETDRYGWNLKSGKGLDVFEFEGVKCGISICHDTTDSREFESFKDEKVKLVFMPSMCEMEGTLKVVDSHAFIFDHARKRSEEVGCYFACVGSVGAQAIGSRIEKNVGGAALYKDGVSVAEIGPISKGRGNTAYVLQVEIDFDKE